jgi:hypothetical protein
MEEARENLEALKQQAACGMKPGKAIRQLVGQEKLMAEVRAVA